MLESTNLAYTIEQCTGHASTFSHIWWSTDPSFSPGWYSGVRDLMVGLEPIGPLPNDRVQESEEGYRVEVFEEGLNWIRPLNWLNRVFWTRVPFRGLSVKASALDEQIIHGGSGDREHQESTHPLQHVTVAFTEPLTLKRLRHHISSGLTLIESLSHCNGWYIFIKYMAM